MLEKLSDKLDHFVYFQDSEDTLYNSVNGPNPVFCNLDPLIDTKHATQTYSLTAMDLTMSDVNQTLGKTSLKKDRKRKR